ncbi:uncharacterized protein SPSC_01739 [Sporisorium scitamineum]|uniref:Mig1 protein n=1 Tax=Sporisorium scitamineum TaxID=49012 RepID=A0A127ZAF8_9BASI|nr:uncharacterized protein SPSC_01739 [Sporisorium scitamineum]
MKIHAALLAAVTFTLFSAGTVSASANWLQGSATDRWEEYCKKGGSKLAVPHICFTAEPALFDKVVANESNFRGFKTAVGEFVIIYDAPETKLVTDRYTIRVSPDKGECSHVTLGHNGEDPYEDITLCGWDYWVLPAYLWE